MTNRFPTSVDPQKLSMMQPDDNPEKGKREKGKTREFWVLIIPLAAVIAFALSIFVGANIFLPAWGIMTLVLYGVSHAKEETNG